MVGVDGTVYNEDVIDALCRYPERYPYLTEEDIQKFSHHSDKVLGDGNSMSPAKGRAALSLCLPRIREALLDFKRQLGNEDVLLLSLVSPHSGTSSGTVIDLPLLIKEIFPSARTMVLLMLPVRVQEAHKRGVYAFNTLNRLKILKRGLEPGSWWSASRLQMVEATLYRHIVMLNPQFRLPGDRASPSSLSVEQLHAVSARILAGFAAGPRDALYSSFMNKIHDNEIVFEQGLCWHTLNEAHRFIDPSYQEQSLRQAILKNL